MLFLRSGREAWRVYETMRVLRYRNQGLGLKEWRKIDGRLVEREGGIGY